MTEITTIRGTVPSEIEHLHQAQSREIYQKYDFKPHRTQTLTIDSYREYVCLYSYFNSIRYKFSIEF